MEMKNSSMHQLLTNKIRLSALSSISETATLEDLLDSNPTKLHLSDMETVMYIRMEDVSEYGDIINHNVVPLSSIKKGLTYFERNDILVAKITPCFENGKGACLDLLKTRAGFGSTEFHVLRAKKNADPKYIFYQTQTTNFRQSLETQMVGTAGQKRVPLKAIRYYPLVVIHSKEEQRAIAAALTDVDMLLTSLHTLIAKKRNIKQSTMQQLLTGKTRLPGFSGVWNLQPIEDIADVTTGDKDTQNKIESGVYPFYVRSQIVEKINSFSYDGEAILTAGDGVGVGKVFHYANGKFDFHQRVYMIYNFKNCDGFFLYLYFSHNFFKEAIKYNAKNSVDSLRRDMITKMKVLLPPLPEQQAIAAVLSDMDAEIVALVQKRDKIRALKQGMMQELLTGKTRLL